MFDGGVQIAASNKSRRAKDRSMNMERLAFFADQMTLIDFDHAPGISDCYYVPDRRLLKHMNSNPHR